jgi:hypothetical protein
LAQRACQKRLIVSTDINSIFFYPCNDRVLRWYSKRFVVITKQLQAAKCSLSSQLFGHILTLLYLKICDFPTVVLTINKCFLDLCTLHRVHASRIFQFPLVINKQISDHSRNSSGIRTLEMPSHYRCVLSSDIALELYIIFHVIRSRTKIDAPTLQQRLIPIHLLSLNSKYTFL